MLLHDKGCIIEVFNSCYTLISRQDYVGVRFRIGSLGCRLLWRHDECTERVGW